MDMKERAVTALCRNAHCARSGKTGRFSEVCHYEADRHVRSGCDPSRAVMAHRDQPTEAAGRVVLVSLDLPANLGGWPAQGAIWWRNRTVARSGPIDPVLAQQPEVG